MKKYGLFCGIALTASIFADGEVAVTNFNSKRKCQDKTKSQTAQSMMVELTSARPESDNGWYLFADALYWHADIGNTDWGFSENEIIFSELELVNTLGYHHLDFKWNWGFRVGLGVNLNHDMWDSNFYYTWFQLDNSNALASDQSVQPMTSNTHADLFNGKTDWKLHFSMFDWELGCWYYVRKNLALRPHVGVKGGWIHQNSENVFTGIFGENLATTRVLTQKFKNHFWGVGPSAGINTMWVLGNGGMRSQHRFSLFGDAGGALMYGHFDVSQDNTIIVQDERNRSSEITNLKNLDRNLAVFMVQGQMGFSWDVAFSNNHNHFTFRAGYELQYWFRQYQQMWWQGTAQGLRYADDLAFQGLTFDFRFDF